MKATTTHTFRNVVTLGGTLAVLVVACAPERPLARMMCRDGGARVRVGAYEYSGDVQVALTNDLDDNRRIMISACWNAAPFMWGFGVDARNAAVDALAAGDVSLAYPNDMVTQTGPVYQRTGRATGELHFARGEVSGWIRASDPSLDATITGSFGIRCTAVTKDDPYFETTFCKMFDGWRP